MPAAIAPLPLVLSCSARSSISRRRYLLSGNHSPFGPSYDYYVQLLHFSSKTPFANTTPTLVFSEDYFVSKYQFSPQVASISTRQRKPPSITTPLLFTEDYFVSKYEFSPEIASKLAFVSARMRKPQNADLFLSFLRETGFSNAHLERVVRHHPNLLSSCPEKTVEPKLNIFHDLGFSADEVTEIIGRDLTILHCKADRIINSLSIYRRLLGSNDHVVKLIKKHNSMLYADPEKTILPNIQFLNECGIQMEQINSLICTIPTFFAISPENLRRCVHKVDKMGVDRTSKMFIYAAWAVCMMSDETLKLKLKSFRDLGFSEDDIVRMFRSAPMVISSSTPKIKAVIEVLLETGKYDMSCIIKNPTSLARSVEKRYKPRLQVLKELERKGLISKWPGLSKLGTIPNKTFFEKFVAPNINEVGEEFIAKIAASSKPKRETGLENILR